MPDTQIITSGHLIEKPLQIDHNLEW